ncbi:hypothetical protein [Rhizobium johnstonii]|uniref:hypothetical protein n=1 Tax=Rhizobium johnstonii TaxID=3019933 RepID=UPI003F95A12B
MKVDCFHLAFQAFLLGSQFGADSGVAYVCIHVILVCFAAAPVLLSEKVRA